MTIDLSKTERRTLTLRWERGKDHLVLIERRSGYAEDERIAITPTELHSAFVMMRCEEECRREAVEGGDART